MRKSVGLIVVSALALSLAACAAPAGPAVDGGTALSASSCTPRVERGGLAEDVVASGEFGVTPTSAEFPMPLVSVDTTSSAVIETGDGPVVGPDDIVSGMVTLFDADTGQVLDQSGSTLFLPLNGGSPILNAAVCATVGSRVAIVGTSTALLGEGVVTANSIDPERTLVMVIDVTGAYLSRAQGADVPPQNGLPTVSRTDIGRPGLSFTNAAAPSDLRIERLIAGTGSTVEEGDTVLLQYTGVVWDTRKVFDSTWENGYPAQLATTDVVPGFAQAIVGQRVGTQVLVTIPPELGYGDSPPSGSGITATDTLVFVIDILGVLPAA